MTSYRLMDGASGRPGVGSSGTQPPASVTTFSGNYCCATFFKVTSACWLQGFWWYVAPTQSTSAQKFTLWSANRDGSAGARGSVISAATTTSGVLSAGFNFVPLATPVPLTIGWTYAVDTGFVSSTGIPLTASQFNAAGPYSAGITNGPLAGFSDQDGSAPDPFLNAQCSRSTAGADPAVTYPTTATSGSNRWIDVQVTDTTPANSTYRLFPSVEGWQLGVAPDYNVSNDADGYTIGNTFTLSQSCKLLKMWFLSPSGVQALPTRCTIWDVLTHNVVADNASPSWLNESGSAGSAGGGWVYCDFSGSGITLPPGRNMITSVYIASGLTWRGFSIPFWGTGGISGGSALNIGASGLNYGVISAPSTAGGVPLQGSYNGPGGAWAFPGTWNNPENDWVDVEVIPLAAASPPAYTASMSSM